MGGGVLGIILCGWGCIGHYVGWVGVNWAFFLGGGGEWEWVGHYFGWVGGG